jgi:hypothetical protein
MDENYTLWSAQVRTGYQVTQHLNASLSYQFASKESDASDFSYTQNRVVLGLGYSF